MGCCAAIKAFFKPIWDCLDAGYETYEEALPDPIGGNLVALNACSNAWMTFSAQQAAQQATC
ncbi:uncharacterized protein PG998_004394 [Apiospora kogelbergensis]|uniref:uncharacterized protein n=1 Tax=Apiospora kogelbergensis TaxID=1337665 RepID=UPI0031304794